MNNSTSSALSAQSLAVVTINGPFHLALSIMAPFCILSNILVILTICLSKELHNKSQMIVLGLSISEVYNTGFYLAFGLKWYLPFLQQRPAIIDLWACELEMTFGNLGFYLVRCMIFLLAVDRLLCVAAAIFYKQVRSKKYVAGMLGSCLAFAVINTGIYSFLFDGNGQTLLPICNQQLLIPLGSLIARIKEAESNAINAVSTLLYAVVVVKLFYSYKKANLVTHTQRRSWKKEMHFDVCMSVSVIGAINFLTAFAPLFLATVLGTAGLPPPYPAIIFHLVTCINSFSHIIVYLALNSKFRKGFLHLVTRTYYTVTSVTPVQPMAQNQGTI